MTTTMTDPAASRPMGEAGETTFGRRTIGSPTMPRMPKVGLAEELYIRVAEDAAVRHDDLTHESAKVGQYLTLAVQDPDKSWGEKLKYFRHALKRHCRPPEHADDLTKQWYAKLAGHARKHCGMEALRLACEVDERYEARLEMGHTADDIAEDAETFFDSICPNCGECPPVYRTEEWLQIKEIRDRWV